MLDNSQVYLGFVVLCWVMMAPCLYYDCLCSWWYISTKSKKNVWSGYMQLCHHMLTAKTCFRLCAEPYTYKPASWTIFRRLLQASLNWNRKRALSIILGTFSPPPLSGNLSLSLNYLCLCLGILHFKIWLAVWKTLLSLGGRANFEKRK